MSDAPAAINPLQASAASPDDDAEMGVVDPSLVSSEKDALLDSAVRSVYAHMAEAPTNWHQATVFLFSSDDPAERARAPTMLASGFVMVLFQWATATGAIGSTTFPSCHSTDQCGRGTYCNIGGNNRCNTCGDDVPLPLQVDPDTPGLTYNHADDRGSFAGFNLTLVASTCAEPTRDQLGIGGPGREKLYKAAAVTSWCEACVHPTSFHVDPMTYVSRSEANASVMATVDWLALIFASYVVGLTIAGEVKDIRLCGIAAERAGGAIAPRWRQALSLLNGIRRWVFLTAFGWIVPNLVALKGGDALNVCFNTIAMVCPVQPFGKQQCPSPSHIISFLISPASVHVALCDGGGQSVVQARIG